MTKKLRQITSIMLITMAISIVSVAFTITHAASLRFGVVPQQVNSVIASQWLPIIKDIRRQSGCALGLVTAPSINDFGQRLAQGRYDVAYASPSQLIAAERAQGYVPIARKANHVLSGIVIVPLDSPHQSLSDLNGLEIAVPSMGAFAASQVIQVLSRESGMELSFHAQGTHDGVYQALIDGRFQAGGGIPRTFNALAPELRKLLRILWTSPDYTPHGILVRPNLPDNCSVKITSAVLSMNEREEVREAMRRLKLYPLTAAQSKDWDSVRDFLALKNAGAQK